MTTPNTGRLTTFHVSDAVQGKRYNTPLILYKHEVTILLLAACSLGYLKKVRPK